MVYGWLLSLVVVGYFSFMYGQFSGEQAGLTACPEYQTRKALEAEENALWHEARKAEAELASKRVSVCDAVAKAEWEEHVADNICYEVMRDSYEEPSDYPEYDRY